MTVDHGLDAEPAVPVGGEPGAAPHGELGVPQDVRGVPVQRVVVDEDGGQVVGQRGEPAFGLVDPGPAPGLAARVGVGVQEGLVGADDPGAVRVLESLVLGRAATARKL